MANTDNQTSQSQNRRKKVTSAVAMILVVALLGGTFAWNNYRQHKTGDANTGGTLYKATLVEEFDSAKAQNWTIDDPVLLKKISVLNPGNTEIPGNEQTYGEVFARVQLKEFMEFRSLNQKYSADRYLIGPDGQFIRFFPELNYKVTVDENGWPMADATKEAAGSEGVFAGGEDAAKEYARLLGKKAGNGTHVVEKLRAYFTPFKTADVTKNKTSIDQWIKRYNEVNGTSVTLKDITVEGKELTLDVESPILPKGMVDAKLGFDDDKLPWYVQTKEGDPNGVYGNFVVIDGQIDGTKVKNLLLDENNDGYADFLKTPIPKRADADQEKATSNGSGGKHDLTSEPPEIKDVSSAGTASGTASGTTSAPDADTSSDTSSDGGSTVEVSYALPQVNGECLYTPHRWTDGMYKWQVNGPGKQSYFDYFNWGYGKDVILLSQWDGKPCKKWILDDSKENTEGWAYWGNVLAPGEQTSSLLEHMLMIESPEDQSYYAVHADMQAVNLEEIKRWEAAQDKSGNDKIVAALRKSAMKILVLNINEKPDELARGTSYTFTSTVQGTNGADKSVIWSLIGSSGASKIDKKTGKVTVDLNETAAKLTVRATSVFDPSKFSDWTFNVVNKAVVTELSMSKDAVTAPINQPVPFTATATFLTGANLNSGVTWSLQDVDGSPVDTKSGNITVEPDPTDLMKAVIKISNLETANIGKTFKVVATAKDPDPINQFRITVATVTIADELDAPAVAAARYIPKAQAGDSSDWLEIAKSGDKYSLIMRSDIIPQKANEFNDLQPTIDGWYAGTSTLAQDAALRKVALANTAVYNPGMHPNKQIGFSYPLPGKIGPTDKGTAFALSFGEAAAFSAHFIEAGSWIPLTGDMGTNYDALGTVKNYIVRTRSTTSPGDSYSHGYLFNVGGGTYKGVLGRGYSNGATNVAVAMWIDTKAAEKAGLLVAR